MNFVQLVERLRQETGAGGSPITTTIGQTGVVANLVNWIRTAWVDIQNQHQDWQFLRVPSISAVPAHTTLLYTNEYQTNLLHRYVLESFRIARSDQTRAESAPLYYRDWEAFQHMDLPFASKYSTPCVFSVRPADDALHFGPAPDVAMQIWYDYIRVPQVLSLDTDVPIIKDTYHDVIWRQAATYYARLMGAPEIEALVRPELRRSMAALELKYTPAFTTASWG